MAAEPDVQLIVSGHIYHGWQTVDVSLGIEQIAGSFSISLTDKWDAANASRPVRAGEACTVKIGSETVITGYIDEVAPEYDAGSHSVSISGRDKTGDLVDCSAIHDSGQWSNRNLLQIATDLCFPFGITVQANVDAGPAFRRWKIQEGESVFECIDRAARIRGLLLVSDGLGSLIITRGGTKASREALVLGQNILRSGGGFSHMGRHSRVIVKGDHAGTDDWYGEDIIERKGQAVDAAISRYRPLIILAEDQVDNAEAQQRATWEVSSRYGRSLSATYTVQGWTQKDNGLWAINHLVKVQDRWKGINDTLLISALNFRMDDSDGRTTEITVTRPEAFELLPLKEPTEKEQEGAVSWAT